MLYVFIIYIGKTGGKIQYSVHFGLLLHIRDDTWYCTVFGVFI